MNYSEPEAKELIVKYNLSQDILSVWKFRNLIPEKYSQELKTPIVSTHDLQQLANFRNALDTEKINISALCWLVGTSVTRETINDFKRQRGLLKLEELVAIKKAINALRISLTKVLNEFEKNNESEIGINLFKSLLKRNEIVWFVFFDRNRSLYQKFSAWKLNRRVFPIEEVPQLKSLILIFLTETSI